jgi:hypothetical protein
MPDTRIDLYRAVHKDSIKAPFVVKDEPKEGLLYPRWQDTSYIARGVEMTSRADVSYARNPRTGETEVQTGGGTSMHDAPGMLGTGFFGYFQVPKGTEYPESLIITGGGPKKWNRAGTVQAAHYQIELKAPMTMDAFKGALDNFARNAVARSVALARGIV